MMAAGDAGKSQPRRRFWKQVLIWSVVYFVVLKLVAGVILFAQHIPPKAVNVDGVIEVLVGIENVLVFPRTVLIRLYPWETTPRGFGLAVGVLNCVVWGLGIAAARRFWRRATT